MDREVIGEDRGNEPTLYLKTSNRKEFRADYTLVCSNYKTNEATWSWTKPLLA
jgi:hypothetical protein